MHVYPIVAAAVWGTLSGLLLPRAAYRLAVPEEEAWAAACPGGHPLPAGPRGWVGPAGCGACRTGAGRPAGEWLPAVAGAALCAGLAAARGAHPELVVWLLLVPVGLTLTLVDVRVLRLPDVLTLPALAGTALLLGGAALLPAHAGSWPRALLGGAALGVLYGLLFVINPAGMGFGDVKLAPTLGLALAWYGWPTLVTGTLVAFGLGALNGLGMMLAGRAHRKTPLPFGPFMLAGAAAALLLA
ncbi:prepilin peptidase [Actinacidiphila epipremni]|uniref:Prepilin peptidase n=1 Tax=Actinacidiphila epipremni TaxID=2053013 RepID=A0ABX0ZFJ0_9ACTN|nr:A24 family peptidase [Actinacidiphila epipremni]NJP42574.1 prepilin peptidase [Actinacidiphila epipremni]